MGKLLQYFGIFFFSMVMICCSPGRKDNIPEEDLTFETPLSPQLNALNEAIQNDPDKPDYYFKRAKIYYADKNYRAALSDINQAIHLDNANNNYFAFLARIYRALNKNTLALKVAKQAEALNSQDPDLYILIAKIYFDLNDKKNADYYLNQSAILAPLHSEIYVLKGNVYARNGDTASALAQYMLALKKDNQNLDALEELAKIYDAKKKFDSSMVFIVKGKSISNKEPYFDFLSGKVYEHLNLGEAAKAAYETALKTDSTFYLASIYLGNIYYKKNNLREAVRWYSYGLKYDNDILLANQRVGEILELSGKAEDAIPYYERASLIDTNNARLKATLKKLYALYPDRKQSPAPLTAIQVPGSIHNDSLISPVDLSEQSPVLKSKQKKKPLPVQNQPVENMPAPVPAEVVEKKEEPRVPSVETTGTEDQSEKASKGEFSLKTLFKKKKKNKDTIK